MALKPVEKQLVITFIIILISGVFYLKFFDLLFSFIRTQIAITDEPNDFTKKWQNPPVPITVDVFIFSIENPYEFMAGNERAKLREHGPYSYKLSMFKDIISFENDNRIVTFMDIEKFYFKPKESAGKLTDRLNILNFPAYAFACTIQSLIKKLPINFGLNLIIFNIVSFIFLIHGESAIKTNITANEVLNGYPFRILDTIDVLTKPLRIFGIKLPDTGMPDNKFGFLWIKNGTVNGPYQTYTGQHDTKVLEMYSFKGETSLNFYDDYECNALNGTEASTLGPNVQRSDQYVFTHDLCRSFKLSYKTISMVKGFIAYRFGPDSKLFASPTKNPFNKCYCKAFDNPKQCDGIFDLRRCLSGAPLAYSFPHFLYANKDILNNVENLRPVPELHEGVIDVDPITGSPLQGQEKIQINAILEPISHLRDFQKVRPTYLPLIWLRKRAIITDDLVNEFRLIIYPIYFIIILIYSICFSSIFVFVILVTRWSYTKIKTNKNGSSEDRTILRPSSVEPIENH